MVARNDEEEESKGDGGQEESHNSRVSSRQYLDCELPSPLQFHSLIHNLPEHTRYLTLPPELLSSNTTASTNTTGGRRVQLTSGSFFSIVLFWCQVRFTRRNTNMYTEYKNAGQRGCRWKKTIVGEIIIFVGLLIYMRVHKVRIGLYWEGSHDVRILHGCGYLCNR